MTEDQKKNRPVEEEINVSIGDGDQAETTETAAAAKTDEQAEVTPEKPVVEISLEDDLKNRLATAEEKLLLQMADFENFKKRQARRQEDFYRTANDSLLNKLLEVIDNFERAIDHAKEKLNETDLLDGTKMIHKQLLDILDRYQVKQIEAVGKTFDPNLHEALMQVDSDTAAEGVITMEISKGYMAGDRVLRHTKVGVSRGPAKEEPAAEKDTATTTETVDKADSTEE